MHISSVLLASLFVLEKDTEIPTFIVFHKYRMLLYENTLFILNYTANGVFAIFIVSTFVRHQNRLKFRLELNGMTWRSGSSRRYYLIGTNK